MTPTTTAAQSLWLEALPATGYPPPTTERHFDVLVLGGGIAGLTTALLLKREGMRVAVVEAGRVASGASGNNTAKVTALQSTRLSTIRSVRGQDVAVWTGGELTLPLLHVDVADTTGGGDAFVAGLVAALPHGPEAAVRWGNAAAGLTVTHLGGRPTLTRGAVERAVRPRP